MSSYYPSFQYMGLNSLTDKNLIVIAFDADEGEMDTFLEMEPIYTEKADGTRRHDYGAKFNSVAIVRISVMKANGNDFTVREVRDFLKWTTGVRHISYLDLLVGDTVKFSFLGRVTNAYQQKMDARIIGLTIEFTSVSPWAYSPIQTFDCYFEQLLGVNDGVLYSIEDTSLLKVADNGTVYHDLHTLDIANNGTVYQDNSVILTINNETDDLYTYIGLDAVLTNNNSDYLSIKNITLDEETILTGMNVNEVVTISANQFIISDIAGKIFGNSFNFIWPRLAPGINEFVISGSGSGQLKFTYRYPIKIGDCAMDIDVFGNDINCGVFPGDTPSGAVEWSDIINTPTTIAGYGITDAYNKTEVNTKIDNIDVEADVSIDEQALNDMLAGVLGT